MPKFLQHVGRSGDLRTAEQKTALAQKTVGAREGSTDSSGRDTTHTPPDLSGEIVELIPALRAFAHALTRSRAEADDLLQESLVKALAHTHQFVPGTNLKAWLFTIERNTFYTSYNKRRRETLIPLDHAAGVHAAPSQDWSLKIKAVDEALQQLPAHQREALMLVGCAGLTYEEAANVCGCALGTIRSRINRGRLRLQELLEIDVREQFLQNERRSS